MTNMMERMVLEQREDWMNWIGKIPYIQWPASWEVKAIPPFCGALIRYNVRENGNNLVSVYLDVFNNLGFEDGPYWEVYPAYADEDGADPGRCGINDVPELLSLIKKGLAIRAAETQRAVK